MEIDKVVMEVERGLSSSGKLKILRLLMSTPDHFFTRYEIGKKVPTDPVSLRNDLKTLVQINWVKTFTVQHLIKYSINLDNTIVRKMAVFLREIKYLN